MKNLRKKLPKTYQGAKVVRGRGMNSDQLDDFVEKKAYAEFLPNAPQWLVIEDRALEDRDGSTQVRVFGSERDALRCAKALANGNIDHRVIKLGRQTFVLGTMNEWGL